MGKYPKPPKMAHPTHPHAEELEKDPEARASTERRMKRIRW